MKTTQQFIEQQQELARNTYLVEDTVIENFEFSYATLSKKDLDTLITQIIQNTGEEIKRRAEGERKTKTYPQSLITHDHKVKYFDRLSDGDIHYNRAIDNNINIISEVTGVE